MRYLAHEYKSEGFHESEAYVRIYISDDVKKQLDVVIVEALRRAATQEADPDGLRRTRFVVLAPNAVQKRNATDALRLWVGRGPLPHAIVTDFNGWAADIDFTGGISQFLFFDLSAPEALKKLKALESTGAILIDPALLPIASLAALEDRVGRYRGFPRGAKATWYGILACGSGNGRLARKFVPSERALKAMGRMGFYGVDTRPIEL